MIDSYMKKITQLAKNKDNKELFGRDISIQILRDDKTCDDFLKL